MKTVAQVNTTQIFDEMEQSAETTVQFVGAVLLGVMALMAVSSLVRLTISYIRGN